MAVMGGFLLGRGLFPEVKEALFLPGEGGNCQHSVHHCASSHVLGATLVLVVVQDSSCTGGVALPGRYTGCINHCLPPLPTLVVWWEVHPSLPLPPTQGGSSGLKTPLSPTQGGSSGLKNTLSSPPREGVLGLTHPLSPPREAGLGINLPINPPREAGLGINLSFLTQQ